MVKIFIDPGHGGADPGAIGNGLKEKDITLAISLKLRDILKNEYSGHLIKLSRMTDMSLSLKQRTDMANKWEAAYLISIHINAGGGTGFESFTYSGHYTGKKQTNQLRLGIHDEIVHETSFSDRGKKEANFHMLRESKMPAILTESGFIDNQIDAHKLKSADFLTKIAQGHAKGLGKIFRLTRIKGNVGEQFHMIQKGDTLWGLSLRNHTTVAKLMDLNQGIIPERLQIGQKVRIK